MRQAWAALPLLLAVGASAAWREVPDTEFHLGAPPERNSADDVKDLQVLIERQAMRTPEECARGARMSAPDFAALFGESGLLSKEELAAVKPFLDETTKFGGKVSSRFKKLYSRPRPYNEDPRLEPCVERLGGSTAYPSFHAQAGVEDACLLGKLFPDRAEKLAAWGRSVGDLRVTIGLHHPTDVSAGQDLGVQVCARLLKEPDFAAELDRVKASLPAPGN